MTSDSATGARTASSHAHSTSAFRAAFPLALPILAGFLLTGITCGIYTTSLGLPWWTPTFMSVVIYAGSAEFIVASMLAAPFNPVATFATIFAVNARHLFYGLSMLEKYSHARRRPYLIYAMCDETFSINYSAEVPEGVDEDDFHFWVSALNQSFWVIGCTLGGLFGSALAVSVKGVSFAMTALFVVIFLDQWLKEAHHTSTVIGFVASLMALVAAGASNFVVPALALILAAVTLMRGTLEPKYVEEAEELGANEDNGPLLGDAALPAEEYPDKKVR